MNLQAQATLKALLSRQGQEVDLLPFFSFELAKNIQAIPFPENPKISTDKSSRWPFEIHYSWFIPVLREYPEKVRGLFIQALSAEQAHGLAKTFGIALSPSIPAFPLLQPFLLASLRESMQETELLSEQHLPPSALNVLFSIKRAYLIHIADLLGIYDLAADLRQVIDKALLSKIQKALTPAQQQFLHYASKQPIKWISPKLDLPRWDGSTDKLNQLLHFRGLIRLAKAVVLEHPSFKWHLLHRLDTGRAKVIQKEFYRKQNPDLVPYFKNQVLHIAKRYAS